jgi:hypothetical protein
MRTAANDTSPMRTAANDTSPMRTAANLQHNGTTKGTEIVNSAFA